MSSVVDKFIKYVEYDTQSAEDSNTFPSTLKQLILGKELVKELLELGLSDAAMDENGYVMATLPSNVQKDIPVIGFMAHMDTSPEITDENVKPQLIENYDGNDIILNKEKNIILSTKDFPDLKKYKGDTLITTDGTTLLGADDKAGVAEIMAAVEFLVQNPSIPHGTIKIAFTPDEEIGRGPERFDVKKFNANFAYTLDGGSIGELECENFNAAAAKIYIHGRNVHPGSAKNKMINSMLIGSELMDMLPANETPANTEGYEGFFHLVSFNGSVEETTLHYIIRDFDLNNFENRKKLMSDIVNKLNSKYGNNTLTLDMKDQYFNMKSKIEPVKHVVDTAFKAMQEVGVTPVVRPIRGGTDGAQLSFKGLPTPNLFTGGENFHGKYEYVSVFAMEKAVEVILKIIEIYTKK